jgi:hypothetical protein
MVQPELLEVKVYTVVTVGVTTIEEKFEPLLQVYEVAPEADSVALVPRQIVLFETVTLVLPKLGLKTFALTHPLEPVPLTENVAKEPAVIEATAPPLIE